jgi:hypothetical protein
MARSASPTRQRVSLHMNVLVAAAMTTAPVVASCGYDVVDPIPPPASCPNLVELLVVSASWVDDGAGSTVVEVHVTAPANRPDVTFRSQVSGVSGGTVVSQQGGSSFVARLSPSGLSSAFQIAIDCKSSTPDDPTRAEIDLTTTSIHTAGTSVEASISELQ